MDRLGWLAGLGRHDSAVYGGVQENWSLLGDDHLENVPESSAMLGSTVDTCSCVSPTLHLG